jgi:predicted secreted protein
MGWFSGFVVFLCIWWVVLFMVLPWGVRVPEKPEKGFAPSAPEQPRLALKAAITTAISLVLWVVIYAIIESGVFSFRDL